MSHRLRHSAYCVVKVGWSDLSEHPEKCICPLLPDVLAIENEAMAALGRLAFEGGPD
jgi:hypothetical protein